MLGTVSIMYFLSCAFYMKGLPDNINPFYKLVPILILLITTFLLLLESPTSRFFTLFAAQFFSLLGDYLLTLPSQYFIFGIAAFLVTQILYTYLFGLSLDHFIEFAFTSILSTLLFFNILLPNLPKDTSLRVAVSIYCVFITLMLWRASSLLRRYHFSLMAFSGFIGAALFYASDLTITVNMWVKKFQYAQLFIMSTYYMAQWLIASAITHLP